MPTPTREGTRLVQGLWSVASGWMYLGLSGIGLQDTQNTTSTFDSPDIESFKKSLVIVIVVTVIVVIIVIVPVAIRTVAVKITVMEIYECCT